MTNAQAISRAIKQNTKVTKSSTGRGKVSTVTSEGYQCTQNGDTVKVHYISQSYGYSSQGWGELEERRHGAIYIIKKVLERKGYKVKQFDDYLTITKENN